MSKRQFDEEAFAKMLEGAQAPQGLGERRMVALASALERARSQQPLRGPNPAFAAALRERIVAEAEKAARLPWHERALASLRARNEAWKRSFRVVTATGLAAMLMLGSSAALASSKNALPGQWNYSLKRAQEGARMAVTGGALSKGYLGLQLARTRLNEVRSLSAAQVRDENLYVDTLNDMDATTITAGELIVRASRSGAGVRPLNKLSSFAIAQRLRLEQVFDQIPPGAKPAARDSISVLLKLNDRVLDIVAGCNCPANPLQVPTAVKAGQEKAVPCSCDGPRAAGGGRGGSGTGSGGQGGRPTPTPQPTGSGTPTPTPTPTGPLDGAVDPINDLLEELGLPTVDPTVLPTLPLPTLPPLPKPSL